MKYIPFDTKALDEFIQFYKDKHSPKLYENNYGKFLEVNINILEETMQEFEALFVGKLDEGIER